MFLGFLRVGVLVGGSWIFGRGVICGLRMYILYRFFWGILELFWIFWGYFRVF